MSLSCTPYCDGGWVGVVVEVDRSEMNAVEPHP